MQSDIKNIQYWVSRYLKPMKKSGCIRKFRVEIDTRLNNRFRAMGFNGRFKDASKLIEEFKLPYTKVTEEGKMCKISRIEARVSNPKKNSGYTSKHAITIRFLIKFVIV